MKKAKTKNGIEIKIEYTFLKIFNDEKEIDEILRKIALGKLSEKDLKGWYKQITKFNAKTKKIRIIDD